jgi:uncharacterized protein involved in cysteine biosynthesis
MFAECFLSTAACVGLAVLGLSHSMPHPHRDPIIVRVVACTLGAAVALKIGSFLLVFFPAMTGVYPVLGVSFVKWCDCMDWSDEAEDQVQRNLEGRRKFLVRQQQRQARDGRRGVH